MTTTQTRSAAERMVATGLAPVVEALLDDGWRNVHPYRKWAGAHWRLLSLVELGVHHNPRLYPMMETVLDWLTGDGHRHGIVRIAGRVRRCASQEGNALLVATAIGAACDPRARLLADSLMAWQWPDGGWNCDVHAGATHSSFHETLAPLRGLAAFGAADDDPGALRAADRAARLLLDHRLFRSRTTGGVIDRDWLKIHWPAYWHYDVLQGLRGVMDAGMLADPGAAEALEWLERLRQPDGTWHVSGRHWWRPPGAAGGNTDVVNWAGVDTAMATVQARAVLAAAGRA